MDQGTENEQSVSRGFGPKAFSSLQQLIHLLFAIFQLQEYKSNLIQRGQELVVNGFPSKIMGLNDVLMSSDFADKSFNFDYEVIKSNAQVSAKVDVIKPLIRELFDDVNVLKMWINLAVPKISDGHNFGVEIQLVALKEIMTVEKQAAAYLNQISRYFKLRADLVSVADYKPDILDYTRAVQETDENEFFNMTLMLREIQNHYTSLHDMISKNMDKLKKPRPSSFDHILY